MDGSALSKTALLAADELAERLKLEQVTAPLRQQGVEVITRAIYDPISPAEGVESYLRDSPGALVVVGWRPRSPLSQLVSRNTPATIIRYSPSAVLVVPLA